MRVLITGITGFVGSHLAEFLLEEGCEVYGTYRWRSLMSNIEHLRERIHLVECDIRDAVSVKRVINEVMPEGLFHLAAQSFVPTSFHAPAETLFTNIIGQVNILEAVREIKPSCKVHIAGSSEEYGFVQPEEIPIKETNPLRPLSPYGVSKVAQDLLGWQYYKAYGLHVVRTRAFNHTGPRRGEVFVCSNFAKQIVEIETGRREPVIKVGNLEAKRDFTDVRDVVRAYWLALGKGEPGEVYNICSGKAWAIKEVLDILLSYTDVEARVEQDPSRMRPADVPLLVGDYSKFHKATGWEPRIPFEQTLKDLLDYWRERMKGGG